MQWFNVMGVLSLCSVLLCAQGNSDLSKLSLEELLNVEIYTASQTNEKSSKSTSITTVLTGEQLRLWGVHSVYEALRYVPGVSVNETYMGYSVATFRGVSPGLYNTKSLFMVDGHPVQEKLFGSSHAEFVPMEAIERIEVVRSPSSVLYGTNAISGVVNIITKDTHKSQSMATLRGGSYDHAYGSLHYHDDVLNISGSYLHDSGYPYTGIVDEQGAAVNFPYHEKLGNVYARYYGDDWEASGGYFREDEARFGLNPLIFQHGPNIQTGYLLDLHKMIAIGEDELHLWGRYDRMEKELKAQAFPNLVANGGNAASTGNNTVQRYSGEVQYKGHINNDSYIIGASYEHDESSPFIFTFDSNGIVNTFSPYMEEHSINTIAFYGQYSGNITESLAYDAGIRVEDTSETGFSGILPRIGVNYQLSDENNLKLSYSEAYRAPGFSELYSNVSGILYGDKNLKREKIQTVEAGYEGKVSNSDSLQISLFYLVLSDEITRKPAIPSGTQYYNGDDRIMYGTEVQWMSLISNDLELTLNATWMDGKQEPRNDAPYLANWLGNLMATYHYDHHLTTNVTYHYEGTKEYVLTNGSQGKIEDYSLINIGATYRIHEHELGIDIKNIFDTTYFVPENVRHNIPQLPGGPGRTAYATYRYYF